MSNFEQICEKLKSAKSAIVSAHVSPDPDAVASSCSMAKGLASLGLETVVYLKDEIPQKIQNLVKGVEVIHQLPEKKFDLAVITDTATKPRVGSEVDNFLALAETSVNIDHHISNTNWADLNYISSDSSSCAEIVFDFLKALDAKIDVDTASLLYSGIIDDTGMFRFSNTNQGSLNNAAELLGYGADPNQISNFLYFSIPKRVMKLRAKALSSIEFVLGEKAGLMMITQQMLKDSGATAEDTDSLVEELRSLEGTKVAIFARQLEVTSKWKISLRSKDESISVDQIAAKFSGGGHKAAAGCTIQGNQDEIRETLLKEVSAVI